MKEKAEKINPLSKSDQEQLYWIGKWKGEKMTEQQIDAAAIEKFGVRRQEQKLLEELIELSDAIIKWHKNPEMYDSFVSEFVDVDIVMNQLRPYINSDQYNQIKQQKLDYLKSLL